MGPFSFKTGLQQCFFNNMSHSTSLTNLHYHVSKGTALAVSDGSFYPSHHIAACAWTVATPDMSEWIQCGCVLPGPLNIHSAYRAELGGLAGLAMFFGTIKYLPIPLLIRINL